MSSVIVCTDAGLCSFKNKLLLSRDGRAYITTQPVLGNAVPSMVKDYVTLDSNLKTSDGTEMSVAWLKEEYRKAAAAEDEKEMKRLKSVTLFKDAWFELSVTKRTATKEAGRKRRTWTETEADLEKDDGNEAGKDVQYVVTYEKRGGGPDKRPEGKNRFYSGPLVSFSLKYWLLQTAELKQKRERIEALAKSRARLDGIPKELRGYAKVDKTTKNELNMLMAKAFGLSLTKQFLKMDALEEYSGLKME